MQVTPPQPLASQRQAGGLSGILPAHGEPEEQDRNPGETPRRSSAQTATGSATEERVSVVEKPGLKDGITAPLAAPPTDLPPFPWMTRKVSLRNSVAPVRSNDLQKST